tara:strand:+ start:215 stop:1015 length:801 start_codon:yes stop_codon:yes gene_type:complete
MSRKNIAIVDADSLLYYEMGKETLEEAMTGIDQRIEDILEKTNAKYLIGFLTLGKCFRYNYAKSKPYKHNRPGGLKPPIFYALKVYVQQKWLFRGVKGLEADDCVGIARDQFYKSAFYKEECSKESMDVIICSPDKDVLQQLPGKHYNYQKSEFWETSPELARDFLWKQVLMGDSTDGIPGIPGLGPKTADKIIYNMPKSMSHHQIVLSQYLAHFKLDEGINRFYETFKLIRIIDDIENVPNEVECTTSDFIKFVEVTKNEEELWG